MQREGGREGRRGNQRESTVELDCSHVPLRISCICVQHDNLKLELASITGMASFQGPDSQSYLEFLHYLSHVFLGGEDKFKVHHPPGELLEQAAVGVDVDCLNNNNNNNNNNNIANQCTHLAPSL